MGQQQLLLILAVTVIVGISVTLGLNSFEEQMLQQEEERYTRMMLDLAGKAQGWYYKAEMMGGGGYSFDGINFEEIACPEGEIAGGDATKCMKTEGSKTYALMWGESLDNKVNLKGSIHLGSQSRRYIAEMDIYADGVQWIRRWEKAGE